MAASRKLDATNVSDAAVRAAVEQPKGPPRAAKLDALAGGVADRKQLFAQLAAEYDAVQAAKAARHADAQAIASDEYDRLVALIDATNLRPADVENVLADPPESRKRELTDLAKQAAADPARAAALSEFVAAADAYDAVKGKVDDAAQLKRELQGSGVLEFHIVADGGNGLTTAERERMGRQLREKGPGPGGDQLAWSRSTGPIATMEMTPSRSTARITSCVGSRPSDRSSTGRHSSVVDATRVPPGRPEPRWGGSRLRVRPDRRQLVHTFTANNKGRLLAAILDRKARLGCQRSTKRLAVNREQIDRRLFRRR